MSEGGTLKEQFQKAKENIAIFLGAWVMTGVFMCEWAKANQDQENLRFGAIFLFVGVIVAVLALSLYFGAKFIYKAIIWLKNRY